jgi:uncharacterized protein (DUF4415 family)
MFEWDGTKWRANQERHRLDLIDGRALFDSRPVVTYPSPRGDEVRFVTEAMSAAEVGRLADEEDGPLPEGWENTVEIGIPATKPAVHLRLDRDMLGCFRSHGPGYQTWINAALRAFMSARRPECGRGGEKDRQSEGLKPALREATQGHLV